MPSRWHRDHRQSPARVPNPSQDDPDLVSTSQPDPPAHAPSSLERPADCYNRFSTPPFALLCTMMDRLRNEEAGKRKETLTRFMDLWRIKVGNDLYPLIRLLLPDRDRERPVYNLKEAMLGRCYIEVLGIDKHSEAAQRLIKWKQPVDGQSDFHSGDFARVCYHEIAARSTVEEGKLSIEALNALLDQLAAGRLKQSEYVPILRKINQQCTPVEQEWIIRIILKDLRISIREKGVFACFHPDAADLFNVCSDLKRVCWTLYKPEIRLEKNQTHIELFRSFLPQLCYRSPSSSHEAIARLVGAPKTEFIMEEKLDGERMQLHMRGGGAQWYYCSRKAKDYTYLYGAHIGEGSLTPHIASAFQDGVRNIILDGEMLVWDPALEKYLAFGTLKTAALDRTKDASAPRPCFKIFDILYLNDHVLTQSRLDERKRLLRSGKIFKDLDQYQGRLEFAEEQRGKSGLDIRAMLERILETKGEGLVVKRLESVYQTNSRGADWVKVKPEYSDQMGENLDLLVLGGWWGKGGRTGKISSLLCGLRIQQDPEEPGQIPEFKTFVKIGSGMSYEDYEWILNKHKDHWKPFDRTRPPKFLHLGATGLDDKPDVYISPQNSFVVEVKASEIVPAGNFAIGYTMRFPRCRYIYWDKASRDHPTGDDSQDRDMWNSLSVNEFLALLDRPTKRYADDENGSKWRKKRRVAPKKKVQLMSSAQGQKLADSEVQSGIFQGMTFFIPVGDASHKKSDLETLVHKNGGDFTQAQLADLSAYVIAPTDKNVRVKAEIKKGVSVIRPEWLFASIKRGHPLPLVKELLLWASDEAKTGRYYNKSVAELDKVSLVRDRTGEAVKTDAEGAGTNTSDAEGSVQDTQHGQHEEHTQRQRDTQRSHDRIDLETEWGLHRSQPASVDTEDAEADDDEAETDPEVKSSKDFELLSDAESHDSDPEEDDTRLLPVLDSNAAGKINAETEGQIPMGAESGADAYDEDEIFLHLVFYIDTPENAAKNGLHQSVTPSDASRRLESAEELIKKHGGRIVHDITEPKLTHVVMDDEDSGRYAEIIRKTSKPKRKHIVLPSWVQECVEEETLMNEDAHKPR